MVYLTKKKIKNKDYTYLVKSIRLPGGSVKKISKLVEGAKNQGLAALAKKHAPYFLQKEKELNAGCALGEYKTDHIFTLEQIEKIEAMRVDYRRILHKLTKKQLQDLFDRFTVNFTYESNAIEGNSLTLKDVAIVIFENASIKGKDLREVYETRNSRKVVDMILKKRFSVSEEDVIKMHRMLVKDMGIETGYKKIPNYLPGRKVETTLPEEVPKKMKSLIGMINTNPNRLHPLELSADAHGEFERTHPFDDGNGRVGRFLINVMLARQGYPPLIIRKSQRLSYLKTLEDSDNGYKDNLRRFILEKYKETFRKFFGVYAKYVA